MPEHETHGFAVPDWYTAERETEKTVQKLNSIKELGYYLQNPDEFIRRLAILRLQKVSDTETAYILKELIDSPAETPGNKLVAAWVLNSRLNGRDDVLFIGSSYTNKLNGIKSYNDLFPVISELSHGTPDFRFETSASHSAFNHDKEDALLEKDIFFESEFDFAKWLKFFTMSALLNIGRSIMTVPAAIRALAGRFLKKIKNKFIDRKTTKYKASAVRKDTNINISTNNETYFSLRGELVKNPGFFACMKKGAFHLFYGLFFPIRFIRRHKLAAFAMLLAAYLLLADTEHGRAFTSKYFGFDMRTGQTLVLQKLKVCSTYLTNGLNRLTGMDEWNEKKAGRGTTIEQVSSNADPRSVSKEPVYTVEAKNGLNIRTSPNASSGKVGGGPLEFGSTVVFLEKKKTDASGLTWYYVEAADGRVGWVSARYLKQKEG